MNLIEGFSFVRPLALLGLPVAVALLVWAFRPRRPLRVVIGTLDWLRDEAGVKVSSRGARRSLPPHALWAAAAIVATSLAASGPRWGAPPLPRTWRVVVDPRPAMALPAPDETASRAEIGAARAAAWLAENAASEDRVTWLLPGGVRLDLRPGELPEPSALAPRPSAAFAFELFDEPATLVVTDLAPTPEPTTRRAGWIAVGALPSPGLLGVEDGAELHWDGQQVVRAETEAPVRDVVLDPNLPGDLRALVRLWAAARRLRVVEAAEERSIACTFRRAGAPPAGAALVVGRDGWSARVEPLALEPGGSHATTWLKEAEFELVRVEPGRVSLAVDSFTPLGTSDPALLAVSFGRLFDGATLPPPGAIDLLTRARSGPANLRVPQQPEVLPGPRASDRPLAAWLAALGAILAALAWTLYAGSSSRTSSNSTAP